MAFAVVKTGGKQYVVEKGDTIFIETWDGAKAGDPVELDHVLLVDDGSSVTIGAPMVKGAKVKGTILATGKAKKIDVVKYKAKSRYLKRRGHRQPFVKVKIDQIS